MAHTLKWYAARWPGFVRVHKQFLINPDYASQLTLAPRLRDHSYVVMQDNTSLLISRRRLQHVQQQLLTVGQ